MTSENSPTVENEVLLAKIGAIEQEIAAVKAAVRWSSVIRLSLLIAVIALLVGAVWMFYNLAMEFTSKENLDLLAAKARERAEQTADPALKELRGLYDNCRPVLIEAFQKQVEADMPKYTEVLAKQRDELVDNLQFRLSEKITARYEGAEKQYQAILQEEFPQVQDPEMLVQVYASISQIMDKLVEKYYSGQLREEIEELSKTWEEFEMADFPAAEDPTLEQQIIASMLKVAALRFEAQPKLWGGVGQSTDITATP